MHTAPYFSGFGLLAVLLSLRSSSAPKPNQAFVNENSLLLMEPKEALFTRFLMMAPLFLVLLLGLEIVQAPVWYIHLTGVLGLLGQTLLSASGRSLEVSGRGHNGWALGMVQLSLLLAAVGCTLWTFIGEAP